MATQATTAAPNGGIPSPGRWKAVAVIVAVIALAWLAFEPLGDALVSYWPLTALAVAIALALWRIPLRVLRGMAQTVGSMFTKQPLKGISIAVILTAVYVSLAAIGYYLVFPWVQFQMGAGWRFSLLVAVVASLYAMFPLFVLYKATGFPGDGTNVKQAAKWFSLIAIVLFGVFTLNQPGYYFDPLSKKPLFMVADKEQAIYFFDPETCAENGGCVSPMGEPLRVGTHADAVRFAQPNWLERIEEWFVDTSQEEALWPNQPADSPVCGKTQKVIATPTEWEPVTEKGEAGVKCRWWLRKVETSNRNMRGLLAVRPDGNDDLVQQYGFRPDGTYARLNLEAFGNVDTLGFKSNEPYPIRLFVYWRPE